MKHNDINGFKSIKLNKKDLDIIRALKDGRRSFSEVADEVQLTTTTVRNRVNRMLDDNTIQIIILVNPFVLHGHNSAFVGFNFEPDKIAAGAKQIESLKGVVISALVSGRYDAMAVVFFNEQYKFEDFISKEVLKLKGLVGVESFFALKGDDQYQLRYVL